MNLHTFECLRMTNITTQAREAWWEVWSGACHKCEGWGGHSYPGTYWEPGGTEPCICMEEGKCPRCGGNIAEILKDETGFEPYNNWLEKELPCPMCGWNWGNNPGDTSPVVHECDCFDNIDWEEVYHGGLS